MTHHIAEQGNTESHPIWMRGLKCDIRANRLINYVAAPHTGAWIEITLCKSGDRFAIVAP